MALLLDDLVRSDLDRAQRQLHLVDLSGAPAAWTGPECVDWAGHLTHEGFSVAGNMLASGEVLDAMATAYRQARERAFAERLLVALEAGDGAGGDKRGRQSAAIFVVGQQPYAELDLRVDDHEQPFAELRRLYTLSQGEPVRALRAQMPRRQNWSD